MATYTYTCTNSDCENHENTFSTTQSMHDDAHTKCDTCEKDTLRRVIKPAGDWRIGGMAYGNTSMWNNSNDRGY